MYVQPTRLPHEQQTAANIIRYGSSVFGDQAMTDGRWIYSVVVPTSSSFLLCRSVVHDVLVLPDPAETRAQAGEAAGGAVGARDAAHITPLYRSICKDGLNYTDSWPGDASARGLLAAPLMMCRSTALVPLAWLLARELGLFAGTLPNSAAQVNRAAGT